MLESTYFRTGSSAPGVAARLGMIGALVEAPSSWNRRDVPMFPFAGILYQRDALLWDSRSVEEDWPSLRGRDRSVVASVLVEYPRKNRSSQSSQR